MYQGLKLYCGSSIPELAHKIARRLDTEIGDIDVRRFPDGEVDVRLNETVRQSDVYLMQSMSYNANDHLMEVLLMADACKRASAGRVTAVVPYLAYSRQDRLMSPRVPISAKVVAKMLTAVGIDRIVSVDIHAGQIQGFYDMPFDHLRAGKLLIAHLRKSGLEDIIVVSPDAGGVHLGSRFAHGLGSAMALIDRRGVKAKSMHLIGDVREKHCIIVDDMVDTGGTLCEAADLLVTSGARSVRATVTHGVLSGSAVDRINRSKLAELICTDTVPLPTEKRIEKITVVSVEELLANTIQHIHEGRSISPLF
ncbi:MAG: ribose-phosphate pyrophosphokinase [Myxococcales bacterium]|nr:ribose-phosphate pyrophosphokinase [Myxococcales bacterium]